MLSQPLYALAAIPDGERSRSPRDPRRHVRRRLDSGGAGLTVEHLSPRRFAEVYLLPTLADGREIFLVGNQLAHRPSGSTETPTPFRAENLPAFVRENLAALPPIPGARRPYDDLRLFVAAASPRTIDEYVVSVLAALRSLVPRYTPLRTAPPARNSAVFASHAERMRVARQREREERKAVARAWLRYAVERGDRVGRIPAPDLYAVAVAERFASEAGEPVVEPGPREFYAIADDFLGPRKRSNGVTYYEVPPRTEGKSTAHNPTTEDLVHRDVDRVADETRI